MSRGVGSRLRGAWDVLATGYDAASSSRYRRSRAWGRALPLDEDNLIGAHDRQSISLEAWDLYRCNEIGRAIGDRFPEYAVWMGIRPQARTTDKAWNQIAEDWWNQIYMPTCDASFQDGVDGIEHQRLALRHRLFSPGCGFVLLDNGQVQFVEGERIVTPGQYASDTNVIEGVRVAKGAVVGYYVCPRGKGGNIDKTRWQYVPRAYFLHCWKKFRGDQYRHVPDIAACLNKLRDYDETDTYVFNKVKADAMNLWKEITTSGMPNERSRGAAQVTDGNSQNPQKVTKHEWGQVWHGTTGEDLEAFQGKTPSSEYVPYLKHELQAIAASLGVSYQIIMLMFTDGNFSQERAAHMHNKHAFQMHHEWVVKCLERRRWNWRIAKAIKRSELPPAPMEDVLGASGRVVAQRSQWYRADWSLPFFDWVDPKKEAEANETRMRNGTRSLKQVIATEGRDREDVMDERAEDIEAAIERSDRVNTKHADAGVTWRDLMDLGGKPQAQLAQNQGVTK